MFAVLKPVRYVDSNEVVEVAEVAIFVGEHFVVDASENRHVSALDMPPTKAAEARNRP